MATATPSPTPNPNAMRFSLDVTLPATVSYSRGDEPGDDAWAAAILGIDGVAALFATADFVTVTRNPGADWQAIVPAVQEAVATTL